MKKRFKVAVVLLLMSGFLLLPACGFLGDPMLDDLWSRNIYPGEDSTYDIGSDALAYAKGYFDDIAVGTMHVTPATELTISSGNITKVQSYHAVDTEGDAATDDLDNILSGSVGDMLILHPVNTNRDIVVRHGVGNIQLEPQLAYRSYSFASPTGGSGTYYVGGFYLASATDANLTQLSTTQTFGTVDISHASHALLVAASAGTTDAGSVSIVVSGTSITDDGVRTTGDSETIVSDITAMSTNEYFETAKKWLGQITYTLTPSGATTYSADFNYGLAKYDDWGNKDFTVCEFEVIGRAGASDTGFNVRLLYHSATGWTYHATAFVPGGTVLADMNADHSTESDIAIGEQFAYKRTNLCTLIDGNDSEGFIIEVVTTANKAVDRMDTIVGAWASDDLHMYSTEHAVMFIYDGVNWLEL